MAIKGSRWSESEIEYLRKHYPYVPGTVIAKRLGRSYKSLGMKASRLGIKKAELNALCVNHFYFDEWSSNMAWMLGFWAADGCAFSEGARRTIIFAQSDKSVLEMVKKEFDSEHKISRLENSLGVSYQFRFTSRRTYKRLKELFGCDIERKSLTLGWPNDLPDEYFRDFVRGLIDGDGSVTFCNGVPTISFHCGSRSFINQLLIETERLTGLRFCSAKKRTPMLSCAGHLAFCLSHFLYYSDSVLALSRKHKKAKDIQSKELHGTAFSLPEKTKELFQAEIASSYAKPDTISGYYGVYPSGNNWKVGIKEQYFGSFKDPREAAMVYDENAKRIYGNIARLNFANE